MPLAECNVTPGQQPELAEEFRPRYRVDVQVLTPEGKADKELPIFRGVPLPLQVSGNEHGAFGFPQLGTVVELAFAYGHPDQPFIRTVLSREIGVPALYHEDLIWQQSDTVRQKVEPAQSGVGKPMGILARVHYAVLLRLPKY